MQLVPCFGIAHEVQKRDQRDTVKLDYQGKNWIIQGRKFASHCEIIRSYLSNINI